MLFSNYFYNFLLTNRLFLFSFLMIGAIAALINFISFTFFWSIVGIPYDFSASIAYLCSVVFHFIANRTITFKNKNMRFLQQIGKYITMVGINYIITISIVRYVVLVLKLSPYFGIIFSIGTTVGTGFLLSRYWVFHSKNLEAS